jgi:hypothetical protein
MSAFVPCPAAARAAKQEELYWRTVFRLAAGFASAAKAAPESWLAAACRN